MSTKANLSNISSKYVLKLMFLYSGMKNQSILNLIKYNKALQNKLDLFYNYKHFLNYKYNKKYSVIFIPLFQILNFIFIFIYAFCALIKGTFNEDNTKINYNKSKKLFIDKINYSLFGYSGFIIIQFIFACFMCDVNSNNSSEIELKKFTKLYYLILEIIYAFIVILDLSYYIIYCIKINFTYKIIKSSLVDINAIKNRETPWFLVFDIIIIIFYHFKIFVIYIYL